MLNLTNKLFTLCSGFFILVSFANAEAKNDDFNSNQQVAIDFGPGPSLVANGDEKRPDSTPQENLAIDFGPGPN